MKPTVLAGIVMRDRAEVFPKTVESALSQRGCEVRVAVSQWFDRDCDVSRSEKGAVHKNRRQGVSGPLGGGVCVAVPKYHSVFLSAQGCGGSGRLQGRHKELHRL